MTFLPSAFSSVTYSLFSGTLPVLEPVLKPTDVLPLVQLASLLPVPSVLVSTLID